jgi:hypothetical protein
MPSEFREIAFSAEELVEAMMAHDRSCQKALQDATVRFAYIVAVPSIRVALEVTPHGRTASGVVHFDSDFLGAALIRFCLDHHIPIPRSASRSLTVAADGLSLSLTIHRAVEKPVSRLSDYFEYDFFG